MVDQVPCVIIVSLLSMVSFAEKYRTKRSSFIWPITGKNTRTAALTRSSASLLTVRSRFNRAGTSTQEAVFCKTESGERYCIRLGAVTNFPDVPGRSVSHAIISKTSFQIKKELMASFWSSVGWSYPSVRTAFKIASFTFWMRDVFFILFSIP